MVESHLAQPVDNALSIQLVIVSIKVVDGFDCSRMPTALEADATVARDVRLR